MSQRFTKARLVELIQQEMIANRTPIAIELSDNDELELLAEQTDPDRTSLSNANRLDASKNGIREHFAVFDKLTVTFHHRQTRFVCEEESR